MTGARSGGGARGGAARREDTQWESREGGTNPGILLANPGAQGLNGKLPDHQSHVSSPPRAKNC